METMESFRARVLACTGHTLDELPDATSADLVTGQILAKRDGCYGVTLDYPVSVDPDTGVETYDTFGVVGRYGRVAVEDAHGRLIELLTEEEAAARDAADTWEPNCTVYSVRFDTPGAAHEWADAHHARWEARWAPNQSDEERAENALLDAELSQRMVTLVVIPCEDC